MRVNTQRAELGLPQFDLPPAEPVFGPNPVAELVVTNTSGNITLKLGVPSPPAEYTLVKPGYGHPEATLRLSGSQPVGTLALP